MTTLFARESCWDATSILSLTVFAVLGDKGSWAVSAVTTSRGWGSSPTPPEDFFGGGGGGGDGASSLFSSAGSCCFSISPKIQLGQSPALDSKQYFFLYGSHVVCHAEMLYLCRSVIDVVMHLLKIYQYYNEKCANFRFLADDVEI